MTDKNNLFKLGKFFIKELKINKLYHKFLKKYGQSGYCESSLKQMVKDVSYIANKKNEIGGFYLKEVQNDYDIIINHINTLIHIYLELGLKETPQTISKFGEELFNKFCIEIFGEEKFNRDMELLTRKCENNVISNDDEILKQAYLELRKYGVDVDFETFRLLQQQITKSLNNSNK